MMCPLSGHEKAYPTHNPTLCLIIIHKQNLCKYSPLRFRYSISITIITLYSVLSLMYRLFDNVPILPQVRIYKGFTGILRRYKAMIYTPRSWRHSLSLL